MNILKLLWDTLVASVMSWMGLIILASMSNNIALLFYTAMGWWLFPIVWLPIIGTWKYLRANRRIV